MMLRLRLVVGGPCEALAHARHRILFLARVRRRSVAVIDEVCDLARGEAGTSEPPVMSLISGRGGFDFVRTRWSGDAKA